MVGWLGRNDINSQNIGIWIPFCRIYSPEPSSASQVQESGISSRAWRVWQTTDMLNYHKKLMKYVEAVLLLLVTGEQIYFVAINSIYPSIFLETGTQI